jgi:hypothetical protein
MNATHLLVQAILFDLSLSTFPWDNVIEEQLVVPQSWRISDILGIILLIGPITSTIDFAMFFLNWFSCVLQSSTDTGVIKTFHTTIFFKHFEFHPCGSHSLYRQTPICTKPFCQIGLRQHLFDLSIRSFDSLCLSDCEGWLDLREFSTSFPLVFWFFPMALQLCKMLYMKSFKR